MSFGYSVYFAESDRNRVIRWDPDQGTAQVVAGESTEPDQKLQKPYGLAIDNSGALLIADKLGARIARLSGGRLQAMAAQDTDGHRDPRPDSRRSYRPTFPKSPTAIVAEPEGAVLAACFNDNTVYRIHADGRLELVLGISPAVSYHITPVQENIPPGEVSTTPIYQPAGIVRRSDGTLFLVERGYQVVREYHPSRVLRSIFPLARQREWMERTELPSEMAVSAYHPVYPGALALDADETLYVAEVAHRCVLAVDLVQGKVRKVVQSRRSEGASPGGISALCFGPDGTAWVMDAGAGAIEAYQPTSRGLWTALGVRLTHVRNEPLVFPRGGAQIVAG